jgi:hypothetical protein
MTTEELISSQKKRQRQDKKTLKIVTVLLLFGFITWGVGQYLITQQYFNNMKKIETNYLNHK